MIFVFLLLFIFCIFCFVAAYVSYKKRGGFTKANPQRSQRYDFDYYDDLELDDDDSPESNPPTKRQLAYARDLGISIPPSATKRTLTALISRALDNGAAILPERNEEKIRAMAHNFDFAGWNEWDISVHRAPGQIRRHVSAALSEYMSIIEYSAKSGFAKVEGESGHRYIINEKGCSCPDFHRRQLPCKHMYYLAMHFRELTDNITDDSLSGLAFTVTGRKQKPVKEYIEAHGGAITDSPSSDELVSLTAVVMSDEAETQLVSRARAINVLILTFDELKNIFPIESA